MRPKNEHYYAIKNGEYVTAAHGATGSKLRSKPNVWFGSKADAIQFDDAEVAEIRRNYPDCLGLTFMPIISK